MQCLKLSFRSGRVEENGNGTAAKEGLADVLISLQFGRQCESKEDSTNVCGCRTSNGEQAERLRYRDEELPPSVWIPQGINYQQGCWVFIVHLYEEGISIYAGLN
jgi:hypothetical protein